MIANLKANLVPILFAIGSALFLAGNLIAICRGWRS
jgi:hypothetical protein